MKTSHAHSTARSAPVIQRHLTLVEPLEDTPTRRTPSRPSASAPLAALMGGLASGFVLASAAAVLGGGSPDTAIKLAALFGLGALAARVRARRRPGRPAVPATVRRQSTPEASAPLRRAA